MFQIHNRELGAMQLNLATIHERFRFQMMNPRVNLMNLGENVVNLRENFMNRLHVDGPLFQQQLLNPNRHLHSSSVPPPPPPSHHHPLMSMTSEPKPRLRWNPHLHSRFVQAINQLGGPNKASPKNIQHVMNIPGLTIPQLKSHLQKYRLKPIKKALKDARKAAKFKEIASSSLGPKPFEPRQGPLEQPIAIESKPFLEPSTSIPRRVNYARDKAPVTGELVAQPISKPALLKVKVEKSDEVEDDMKKKGIDNSALSMMGFPNPILVKREKQDQLMMAAACNGKSPPLNPVGPDSFTSCVQSWLVGSQVAGGGRAVENPAGEDPSAMGPI
ncbi:myb family transcription factor PHL13-like [Impatiens glandulifera]|uniref:myb family transcription factor PHL13-like n=1 Tax=Impatiens glandulifera TaxID=253017 RepID=UPI001FB0B8A0|nr:myb family transcription factor PHL13-like [Impatiens glandulifera]